MDSKSDMKGGGGIWKKTKLKLPDGQQRNKESKLKASQSQDTNNGGKSEENVSNAENNCVRCEVFVIDEDSGLCCEVCDIWYHIQWEHFPKQIYDFMVSEEAVKQLNWTCSFCEWGYGKINKMLKRIHA